VVDIVGLDRQADGGTHVASTTEVGRVRIAKVESKGKGFRRIRLALDRRPARPRVRPGRHRRAPACAAALRPGPVTFYVGFDPTAPSLHAGNLVGMMAMAWLQRLGHRPIALAGGATGRIGDPSGRDAERELLDEATLAATSPASAPSSGWCSTSPGPPAAGPDRGLLVDNHDWPRRRLLDFLRDVGKHVSVNQMIARESVKRRLESREQGLTYTEFSYQLLQAYDFAHLYAPTAACCRAAAPTSGATSSPGST
jgi:hypothetical protein